MLAAMKIRAVGCLRTADRAVMGMAQHQVGAKGLHLPPSLELLVEPSKAKSSGASFAEANAPAGIKSRPAVQILGLLLLRTQYSVTRLKAIGVGAAGVWWGGRKKWRNCRNEGERAWARCYWNLAAFSEGAFPKPAVCRPVANPFESCETENGTFERGPPEREAEVRAIFCN